MEKKALSIICPSCGLRNSRILETRQEPGGLFRRRKCKVCDATWTTVETMADKDAIPVRASLEKIAAEVADLKTGVEALLRQAKRLEQEIFDKIPEAPNENDRLSNERIHHI